MLAPGFDVAIVYNGEVYNYPELADQIRQGGTDLRSSCDTEAVLELYLKHGLDCFRYLEGMFALGIYDGRTGTLVLARDRLGKKPLYWTQRRGLLAFASEIKALEALPELDLKVDPHSLLKYLQMDYVPTPFTIYEGVGKLSPGHYLVLQEGKVRIEPYWRLDPEQRFAGSYGEACDELDGLLDSAVRHRLLSDVPLGVFLSGGLDSTTVAYYASKHHPRVKTFSIAFEDPTYDESAFARTAADFLGTEHEEWTVTAGDLLSALLHGSTLVDEPLGDSSVIPSFLLAKHTSERVKVAVGGDGGDELFAGYPTYLAETVASGLRWMPRAFWGAAEGMLDTVLPPSSRYLSGNFVSKRFVKGMQVPAALRHQRWLGTFSCEEAKRLLCPDLRPAIDATGPCEDLVGWTEGSEGRDRGNDVLHEYLWTYLMDEVMVKVDRATMAVSLEARSPFLDHRLVELAFSLPYAWKYRGGRGKRILKDAMRRRLPREIVDRKKKGFGMPIAQWLRGELRDWTRDQLRGLDRIGIAPEKALALHDRHLAGEEDLRKELWNLLALAQFVRRSEVL
jgi:asparagine synthase (glutamine-hydrolysing)